MSEAETQLNIKIRAVHKVQPPRSRSSTGKTKKKIKIESFSNGLNHRGSFCGVRFGFSFSAESPCELRFCELFLTSDRCVGARVSLRSRRWFFLCGWPPVSCFRNETLTAFVFCVMFASIIKNRPARGGFLFQLGLCGPNTKLCRWYRTFFEILLRFPAFFGPRGVRVGVPCSMHRSRRQGKSHSVEVVRES